MLDFSCLLVNVLLDLIHAHAYDLPLRLTAWHFNYVSAAHWAYLKLSEPFSKASFVKNVAAIRNLLKFLLLFEFLQTNSAIVEFASVFVVMDIVNHPHVSLDDFINLLLVVLHKLNSLFFKSESLSHSSVLHH